MGLEMVMHYLATNPLWVYIAVFIFSFIEFVIIVGNIIPGTTILFGLSFICGHIKLSLPILFLSSLIGVYIGDILSYYLGKKYGKRFLDRFSFFYEEEREFEKKEKTLKEEGKWLSFYIFGKLNSIIRSLIGFTAGMRKESFKKYFIVSSLGNFLWILVFVIMPYCLGQIASRFIYIINLSVLLLIFLIFFVMSLADGSLIRIIKKLKEYREK